MIAGKKSFPSPSTREGEGDGEPGGDKHRPYSSEKILNNIKTQNTNDQNSLEL